MTRRARWGTPGDALLTSTCEVRVRFQEVDSLRVVWHGHYLTYFEEGRTSFGREFGFRYQDILDAGFVAPIVHVELDYYRPAHFDQVLKVVTRLHEDPGARVQFSYEVRDDGPEPLATGSSVQVFTEPDGTLLLTQPEFFVDFLRRARGADR